MEAGTRIAEARLAGRELAEVLGRLRHDVVAQFQHDASGRLVVDRNIEIDLRVFFLGVSHGDVPISVEIRGAGVAG